MRPPPHDGIALVDLTLHNPNAARRRLSVPIVGRRADSHEPEALASRPGGCATGTIQATRASRGRSDVTEPRVPARSAQPSPKVHRMSRSGRRLCRRPPPAWERSAWERARCLAIVLLTASALVILPATVQAADPGLYVALGDSYTAAPLAPFPGDGPPFCLRSTDNYPSIVARTLPTARYRGWASDSTTPRSAKSSPGARCGDWWRRPGPPAATTSPQEATTRWPRRSQKPLPSSPRCCRTSISGRRKRA